MLEWFWTQKVYLEDIYFKYVLFLMNIDQNT